MDGVNDCKLFTTERENLMKVKIKSFEEIARYLISMEKKDRKKKYKGFKLADMLDLAYRYEGKIINGTDYISKTGIKYFRFEDNIHTAFPKKFTEN